MPKSVRGAFDEFVKETVNLDKNETTIARNSRDWLLQQIAYFEKDKTFPKLCQVNNIHFGSFARKTKIRPLDDIDLMICLSGQGGHYNEFNGRVKITINPETNLKSFCNDNSNILNSIKVLNKFVGKLSEISQYSNAEIKRNQEAATLNLKSYDWTFDIVPCFFTNVDINGKNYYLIPDGEGNWKKTDPRLDRDRIQNLNQKKDGNLLEVIRILKYWNKNSKKPTIPSYLLENIILNFYDNIFSPDIEYIEVEVMRILHQIEEKILSDIYDPKRIQGNINNLTKDQREKISNKAKNDYLIAYKALCLENEKKHEKAINKWKEIFGSEFPNYE